MANAVDAIKTKRDINRMKNALNGRDKDMFVFGVSLGLRISDLLTLKNGDLRGQTHLKLREGKTGKMRPIKLSKYRGRSNQPCLPRAAAPNSWGGGMLR